MRYLLTAINAKYIHSNLGVYSLKAYADQMCGQDYPQADIQIGEYTINHSQEMILADIYRKHPDVVGFSCYIWNIEYVKHLLQDLPKILPELRIWLGGPEVSYNGPELLAEFPQVTGVMAGEGEETFARLVAYYEENAGTGDWSRNQVDAGLAGESRRQAGAFLDSENREQADAALDTIPGIVYRSQDTGAVCQNPPAPLLDMSRIPFPYRGLKDFEHRIIYYESSRGCPFSCSYCLSSIDKAVRFRNLALVKEELQFFLDQKVLQVKFVDRTFNCKKSHAMAIWEYITEHDNGVTNFHFEIAADLLDDEEIALFRRMRPGLIQLEIGVQSTYLPTIEAIRRRMDLEKVRDMTAKVREGRNIHQHLDLIAGLPFEDLEHFRTSFDQVYRMRPDQLQLGFLKVLKGSYMEEQKDAYDLTFTGRPPYEVLSTRWLDYGDVLRLKQVEEMVEVHYNSGQFGQTIRQLERLFSRPVEMFEALADWYAGQRLTDIGHSRQARYEIFFDFIRSRFPEETENFRDALTVDVYLRENAKTRPVFARDLSGFREPIRQFYQREERQRRYLKGYDGYDARQLGKMTHVEVLRDGRTLLFDYRNREPLSHNASVFDVDLKSNEKQM